MRRSFLLICVFMMTVFASYAAKIALKGSLEGREALSLIVPSYALNIDDYVEAYLENKTVSVEFKKVFRKPVTITIFDDEGNVVSVRGGLVIPVLEELSLNHCGSGTYTLLIEDYAGTYLYGDFNIE